MLQITATEFKTNFGKYLALAETEDIRITKNGKSVVKLSAEKKKNWVDELREIIGDISVSDDFDEKEFEMNRVVEKYESLG